VSGEVLELSSGSEDYWNAMIDRSKREHVELHVAIEGEVNAGRMGPALGNELLAYLESKRQEIEKLNVPSVTLGRRPPWYFAPEHGRIWRDVRSQLEKRLKESDLRNVELSSTRLVNQLAAPALEEVDSRGLVIGNVQSGKTVSFTSLSAMAVDGGYQILIVLAGTTNILRKQTQKRLSREFILHGGAWFSLTDDDNDFTHQTAGPVPFMQSKDKKTILVIKKNPTVLRRLIEWLSLASEAERRRCPVLVIDDEADQASINTAKSKARRTAINQRILDLLRTVPNSAYVGYTATPFANVLIDPTITEDLYPRSFISVLETPPSYFGSERLFGRPPLDEEDFETASEVDIYREISPTEATSVQPSPSSLTDFLSAGLPQSLQEALDFFVLSCAAREARGDGDQHMTMLIHTTASARAHEAFRIPVEKHVQEIITSIRLKNSETLSRLSGAWAAELKRVEASQFGHKSVSFQSIQTRIEAESFQVGVVVENYLSQDNLCFDEDDGKKQIVIGGNVLSRGLTLEGLMVSYYARRVKSYDTLLQMGRWFGYRPGYEDLIRVWMTTELFDWFRDIARVETEIRLDIARYCEEGLTPLEATIRIRTHSSLLVTARNKMHAAVTFNGSYQDRRMQMRHLIRKGGGVPERNLHLTRAFIEDLGTGFIEKRGYQWASVSSELVLQFLSAYGFATASGDVGSAAFLDYVKRKVDKDPTGPWNQWEVWLVNVTQGRHKEQLGDKIIGMANRSRHRDNVPDLMVPDTEVADIGALVPETDWDTGNPQAPRLLIYIIDAKSSKKDNSKHRADLDAECNLVGLAVKTPSVAKEDDVDRVGVFPPGEEEFVDEELDHELEELEKLESNVPGGAS
jgi:hypothetical protein